MGGIRNHCILKGGIFVTVFFTCLHLKMEFTSSGFCKFWSPYELVIDYQSMEWR
jgi:hypothetical protein